MEEYTEEELELLREAQITGADRMSLVELRRIKNLLSTMDITLLRIEEKLAK